MAEAQANHWPDLRHNLPVTSIFSCGLGQEFCIQYTTMSSSKIMSIPCACGLLGDNRPVTQQAEHQCYKAVCRHIFHDKPHQPYAAASEMEEPPIPSVTAAQPGPPPPKMVESSPVPTGEHVKFDSPEIVTYAPPQDSSFRLAKPYVRRKPGDSRPSNWPSLG